MGDLAHRLNDTGVLFDGELDRLIVRFEGLMRVSRLLEERGASDAELDEHRLALERVSRELATFVRRGTNGRTGSAAA
jgi:hypothetical protein